MPSYTSYFDQDINFVNFFEKEKRMFLRVTQKRSYTVWSDFLPAKFFKVRIKKVHYGIVINEHNFLIIR